MSTEPAKSLEELIADIAAAKAEMEQLAAIVRDAQMAAHRAEDRYYAARRALNDEIDRRTQPQAVPS